MFIEERHQAILEIIKQNGRISIGEIQQKFEVSVDSARRDLRILEEKGLLKRTHGGAIPILPVGFIPPRKRNFENMEGLDNYESIAKKAATLIKADDVIYLTGGTFGFMMLKFLPKDINYTLVINSIMLASKLTDWNNITVFVTGGKMRMNDSALVVDSMATAFVKNLHFDLSFITGAGVTANFGLSNSTDETATFQRAIIENSRQNILLMPSQKVGVNAFVKVSEIDSFDILITDWDSVEDELMRIEEADVNVIIVDKQD
ncbi:MAG: DeoR/GlpR family DNA-binding transcription regulator [Cellulosilyticaceae bacterium]